MSADDLYHLLPAIVRLRDGQAGGALAALSGVVQAEADRLADDLDDLYDDWFIETCRDWVVPYLGELVAARAHYAFGEGALSLRGFVADTLSFRRRKGTASMLEDLAFAVTGWTCRAVELFTRVATTQHADHPRLRAPATVSLRSAAALDEVAGPFDPTCRLVDVRGVRGGRAGPNLPDVALFLWRLTALEHRDTAAVADASAGPGRFRFDPLGVDRRLFGPARTLDDRALDVTAVDVPDRLGRRPLFDELTAARAALAAGAGPVLRHFAAGGEAFTITVVGETAPIPPTQVQICNLDAWATLPAPITTTLPDGATVTTRVAVDPASGRLAFLGGAAPAAARVTYHQGTPALIGAGPDARVHAGAADVAVAVADWTVAEAPGLADALAAWVAAGRPSRTVELTDSGRYAAPPALALPAGCTLTVRARGGQRPVLALAAPWTIRLAAGARLIVDGPIVTGGGLVVRTEGASGAVATVELRHATVVPGRARDHAGAPVDPDAIALASDPASTGTLRLRLDHAITGRLDLGPGAADFVSELEVADSVVDGAGGAAPVVRADSASIARATVLGGCELRGLEATDSLFTGRVVVERTQAGCVRFSYVTVDSKVPRRYRCQPALALAAPDVDAAAVLARVVPAFTSTRYGDAAYVQLAATAPDELRTGGSDGSELGAHFHLHQPQREANLRHGTDEYLRFGLQAGLVFVT